MRNLIFLTLKRSAIFCKELFDAVEAHRDSEIAELHFRAKLKRDLTFANEISQDNATTSVFAILERKISNNLLKTTTFINIAIEMNSN